MGNKTLRYADVYIGCWQNPMLQQYTKIIMFALIAITVIFKLAKI